MTPDEDMTPDDMLDAVAPFARLAFHAALHNDMAGAAAVTQGLADVHGGEGVMCAVQMWLDTALTASGVRDFRPELAGTLLVRATDPAATAEFVDGSHPPEVVWASRMMTARARGDQDMFVALVEAVWDDPGVFGRHILYLLNGAAMTYRAARSGQQMLRRMEIP